MKKISIIIVISLLFGGIISPVATSITIDTTNEIETYSENKNKEQIVYLTASSSYDYGLQVGRDFLFQYKMLDILARFFKNDVIADEDIKKQIDNIEKYSPFFLEELEGLSTITNIDVERLVVIQNIINSIFFGGCTTTLSTGKATKNNETFLTQNIDINADTIVDFVGLIFYQVINRLFRRYWVARINTMKYNYAFFGIPILKEIPIINEKGLGFGGNGIRTTENPNLTIDEGKGIPTHQLIRLSMMTCANVSEVAKLWKNSERAADTTKKGHHWTDFGASAWCDKEGNILMIEQSHSYIITVFGNSTDITKSLEDILWHANHNQWLDSNLTGTIPRIEYPSSAMREDRAHDLLKEHYGNITLEICKKINRDHEGGIDKGSRDSSDICRHPDKDSLVITSHSWIVVPKKMTVYWTRGSPCRSRFIKTDFSKIFC